MSFTRHPYRHGRRRSRDDLKQVFDQFFGDGNAPSFVTSQWTPRCDIREEAGRFLNLADLPGVDPKDIEISMDAGILTLRGERTNEAKADDDRFSRALFSRVERAHGQFHRRFALPDSADAEGIAATGRHGVLEISIPKRPAATPRRIQVQ